jgi:hypothetical protein
VPRANACERRQVVGEPLRERHEVLLCGHNHPQRCDGRSLVTRHAGAKQARHGGGGQHADEADHNHEFDERKTASVKFGIHGSTLRMPAEQHDPFRSLVARMCTPWALITAQTDVL